MSSHPAMSSSFRSYIIEMLQQQRQQRQQLQRQQKLQRQQLLLTTFDYCLTSRLGRVPPNCLGVADVTFTSRMPILSHNQQLQSTDSDGCVDSVPISLR